MYKNFYIAILAIIPIIAIYSLFTKQESSSITLENGIWIESGRNLVKLGVSEDKFIMENIAGKNLLFFSQISANRKNYYFPLTNIHSTKTSQYQPLKLDPFLPCVLTTSLKKSNLIANFNCNDDIKGSITFVKNSNSLFDENPSSPNLADNNIAYLKKIADIEFLNRETESLKSNIDKLSKITSENNLQALLEKLESNIRKFPTISKNVSNLEEVLTDKQKQIEAGIKNKRNLIRSSSYGAEVELASRINSVEWQISLNRWNDLIPSQNMPIEILENENKVEDASQASGSQSELPNETNQVDNNSKSNSWWKEF